MALRRSLAGSSAPEMPRLGIRPWGLTPWTRMLIPYEPDLGRDAINDAINEAIKSRPGVKKVELVKIIGKNSSMGWGYDEPPTCVAD